jgi:hypothetical protein
LDGYPSIIVTQVGGVPIDSFFREVENLRSLINETQQEDFGLEVMAANITCDGVYESEVWAVGLKVSVSISMKCYFFGSCPWKFFNFRDFSAHVAPGLERIHL